MSIITYTRKDQKKADKILRKQRAAIYRKAAEYAFNGQRFYVKDVFRKEFFEYKLTSPTTKEIFKACFEYEPNYDVVFTANAMSYLLAAEIAEQGQWFDDINTDTL